MGNEIHTYGSYFASGSNTTPHYEPPTEDNVGNEIRDPSDLVAWFSPITLDPALLDFLNSPLRPISGNNNSGMPSEITLEDDLTHPDLVFVKYVVQQYQSLGAVADEKVLNGISGVDFADPEFVQQAYEWVDELAGSDLWLSIDVASWLFANGAYDPDQPAPTPDFVVNNPPVQVSYDSPQEAIQANGVPLVGGQAVNEFSVMNLPSGVLADPGNPEAGYLTVTEAAQQTLYLEYKAGIDNGSIPANDPRAHFVYALEAKAALQGGYDLIPYYEKDKIGNRTNRDYPEQGNVNAGENADGQITYELSPADAAALIDEEAVDTQINTLWADPTIQGDFAMHVQAVVDTLPNKDALSAQLSGAITSPAYLNAIEGMAASGFAEEAMQLTASNLSNLSLLDPELAKQAQTDLALHVVASELNALLADPSKLSTESIGVALQDSIELAIRGLRAGVSTIRHTSGTIDYFAAYAQGFANDPKSVEALSTVFKQLVIDAKNGLPVDLSNVSPEAFQSAMDRTYIPASMRGGLTQFMAEAQDIGVWGSIAGGASLAAFGYQVANGAFDANSTASERWGAARDLISFGSVVGHVSKTGATVADSVINYFDETPNGNAAWQALGLDRTLPELYGRNSINPFEMDWGQHWEAYNGNYTSNAASQLLIDPTGNSLNGMDATSFDGSNASVSAVEDIFAPKAPLADAGAATKISGTVLKVVGTVSDLFGVADIVMGGIAAKQAVEVGDRPMVAVASLQAVSGGFTAAAGTLGTAALVAPLPTALAGAAAPLFMAGAAIGAVALVVMIGLSVHRKNEMLQENTTEQGEFFEQLADQGLVQDDWGDKLEYLRYAWSVYGNDNPDQTQSYFDYQQAEWEHFRDTAQTEGTSLYRLSEDLHVYHDRLSVDGRKDPNTVSDWGSY
jgi:hypothetical protein